EANEKLDLNRAVRGEIIIANVELTIATVIYAATGARELESTVVGRGRGGRGVRGISKKVRSLLSETNAGKSGLYTGEGVGRRNNCGNCAFSAAHTLAGRPTGAMPSVTGETFGEVAEALGVKQIQFGWRTSVVNALQKAGPGSQAIVAADFMKEGQ